MAKIEEEGSSAGTGPQAGGVGTDTAALALGSASIATTDECLHGQIGLTRARKARLEIHAQLENVAPALSDAERGAP